MREGEYGKKMNFDEALALCKKELLKEERIVGVGRGKRDDNEIIIVMIEGESIKKIPREFEGFEVEVREVGELKVKE